MIKPREIFYVVIHPYIGVIGTFDKIEDARKCAAKNTYSCIEKIDTWTNEYLTPIPLVDLRAIDMSFFT